MHDAPTVRAARARFFAQAGFPADGGYRDPWAEAEFGPVRYRVPNGGLRARALRLHDLHHVATGYATDWRGESEISGWELGSGGAGSTAYAWLIALWGVFVGLLLHPGPTFRAFVRGRGSTNLYGQPWDPTWLDQPLGQLRDALSVQPERRATPADAFAFAPTVLLAVALGTASLVPAFLMVALAAGRSLMSCPLGCAQAI